LIEVFFLNTMIRAQIFYVFEKKDKRRVSNISIEFQLK
jgi:hypothetical protein